MSALPYLTDMEIDDLCRPLRRNDAKTRKLCAILGVKELPRRPDGSPIVGRKLFEDRISGQQSAANDDGGFNWSR
ncbi:MAG: hypothetical protein ACK5NE_08535 [Brachymonas sp.]